MAALRALNTRVMPRSVSRSSISKAASVVPVSASIFCTSSTSYCRQPGSQTLGTGLAKVVCDCSLPATGQFGAPPAAAGLCWGRYKGSTHTVHSLSWRGPDGIDPAWAMITWHAAPCASGPACRGDVPSASRAQQTGGAHLRDKGERPAAAAGPGRAPSAVHVVARLLGQVKVDHQVHCGDVQAPAGHIGREQQLHPARLEPARHEPRQQPARLQEPAGHQLPAGTGQGCARFRHAARPHTSALACRQLVTAQGPCLGSDPGGGGGGGALVQGRQAPSLRLLGVQRSAGDVQLLQDEA